MKLNISTQFTDKTLESNNLYSFVNFASINNVIKNKEYEDIIFYCDGMLTALFFSLLIKRKINRVSFDFTSIAGLVFKKSESMGDSIFIIGATSLQIEAFKEKLIYRYPKLNIAGYSDGYFKKSYKEMALEVINSGAKIAVIGLGAENQERFLIELKKNNFNGLGFTCGGFIRQESMGAKDYYPKYINKLNLRWLYRMLMEPHTIKRYVFHYPLNIFKLAWMIQTNKLVIEAKCL